MQKNTKIATTPLNHYQKICFQRASNGLAGAQLLCLYTFIIGGVVAKLASRLDNLLVSAQKPLRADSKEISHQASPKISPAYRCLVCGSAKIKIWNRPRE